MSQWEERKDEFIRKLEKSKTTFRDILAQDKEHLVFTPQHREKIEELIQRNDKVLNKLKKGEFTVAIVGLEKAGKSTLGNALLKNMILPEYTERCTYTTTEIRAGSETRGEIVFYSREEFQSDFQKMMEKLGYEGSVSINMPPDVFDRWWEQMAENDLENYNKFNGTIAEDVRAILTGHTTIQALLGQMPRTFVGADALQSPEFKIYITGIEAIKSGIVVRSAHPYAVKKVNIESVSLGDMSHIVLYDVPGFDSPTDLHKKQTAEMLRDADAIILVTNAEDRPDLTGPQLNMLRKERDADNVPLRDKVFVFGNKIDKARTAQVARDSTPVLRKEADKHRIAKTEHVICGSAKVFLEGLDLWSEDDMIRGKNPVKSKFDAWGLPDGDGISVLRDKMKNYYENDRYAILESRAENTLRDAREMLEHILAEHAAAARGDASSYRASGAQMLALRRELRRFVEEAKVIGAAYNKQALGERPFSKIVTEHTAEIYPDVDEAFVQRTELTGNLGVGILGNIERLNALVRDRLQVAFSKEIVQRTATETEKLEQEIYDRLAEKFLEVTGVGRQNPNCDELRKSVLGLFDEVMREHDGEHCRFNTLVERFTTDPIEAIIKYVFAGAEDSRLNKLIERHTLSQFYALAAYYNDGTESSESLDVNDNTYVLQMFSKILAHEDSGAHNEAENEQVLNEFITQHREKISTGVSLAVDLLPLGGWAKQLSKVGIKLAGEAGLDKRMEKLLSTPFYQAGWQQKTAEERREAMQASVDEICQQSPQPEQRTRKELLQEFSRMGHEKKQRQLDEITQKHGNDEDRNEARKAQMIDEINEDISILRDITKYAVMDAINLEKAFVSVITNNINLICESFDEEHENKIDAWIAAHIDLIKAEEFAQIQRDEMDSTTRRNIVEAVQKRLAELDREEV
jgi:hypothetical protein